MGFNRDVIRRRRDELHAMGVRVRWAGRRPRLWRSVIGELEDAEELHRGQRRADAADLRELRRPRRDRRRGAPRSRATSRPAGSSPAKIDEQTFARYLDEPDMPDVDLFLRSSGEQRTSQLPALAVAPTPSWSSSTRCSRLRPPGPVAGVRASPAATAGTAASSRMPEPRGDGPGLAAGAGPAGLDGVATAGAPSGFAAPTSAPVLAMVRFRLPAGSGQVDAGFAAGASERWPRSAAPPATAPAASRGPSTTRTSGCSSPSGTDRAPGGALFLGRLRRQDGADPTAGARRRRPGRVRGARRPGRPGRAATLPRLRPRPRRRDRRSGSLDRAVGLTGRSLTGRSASRPMLAGPAGP